MSHYLQHFPRKSWKTLKIQHDVSNPPPPKKNIIWITPTSKVRKLLNFLEDVTGIKSIICAGKIIPSKAPSYTHQNQFAECNLALQNETLGLCILRLFMILSGVINKKRHNLVKYVNLNVAAAPCFMSTHKISTLLRFRLCGAQMQYICMKEILVKFIWSKKFMPLLSFRYLKLRVAS